MRPVPLIAIQRRNGTSVVRPTIVIRASTDTYAAFPVILRGIRKKPKNQPAGQEERHEAGRSGTRPPCRQQRQEIRHRHLPVASSGRLEEPDRSAVAVVVTVVAVVVTVVVVATGWVVDLV